MSSALSSSALYCAAASFIQFIQTIQSPCHKLLYIQFQQHHGQNQGTTMWGGQAPAPNMANIYGGGGLAPHQQQPQSSGGGGSSTQKHDIFVGNLAFNTTEEQLMQAFSEIGRVLNVRMVTDQETGKARGFAFVEFEDPQAALSAIRNMNDYELNGRRLRVNFSNSSHLEALAGKLGMDLSKPGKPSSSSNQSGAGAGGGGAGGPAGGGAGTNAVADAIKGFSKGEMYDVVAKLKEIADRDPDEARRVISGHPQLPEALLFIMSKLDMVKTPLATDTSTGGAAATAASGMINMGTRLPTSAVASVAAPPPSVITTTTTRADPRAAARAADPRARAADPRQQQQQRTDPRARAAAAPVLPPPPPPPPPPPQQRPPAVYAAAAPQQQQQGSGIAHLDPNLVQQVMSLTPQQIQQMPPDAQQNILTLRQQIQGSM